MLQQNDAEAVGLFQQALACNSGDALAQSDLAAAERLSGDSKRAAQDSEEALQKMPLLPYALAEHWQDQEGQNQQFPNPGGETWTKIIANDPLNYIAVASWYHRLGAWKASDNVLQLALKNPESHSISAMAYYYLASNARHEGDLQLAEGYAAEAASLPIADTFPNRITDAAVLTEAVQHGPSDTHAAYALGNFLFAHARYNDAAGLWENSLNQGFDNPVLVRNLGVYAWLVKKDLSQAADYYSHAIHLSPDDYRLYTDLDQIYEEQGNNDARINLFHNAPAEVLDQDTVRARQALLYIEISKPEKALALLANHSFKPWEGGTAAHNMFVAASIEKGRRHLAEHHPDQAEQAFRQAMQFPENLGTGEPFQPDFAEQFYWLGTALQAQGKNAEAAVAWQRSAAQQSDSADASAVFSAVSYRKLEKNVQAQKILTQCIKSASQPDADASSFYIAGLAEQYNGHAEVAANNFRHALLLDPLLWQARVALTNLGNY